MTSDKYERQVQLRLETQTVTAYLEALSEGTLVDPLKAEDELREATYKLEEAHKGRDYLQILELTEKRQEAEDRLQNVDLEAEFIKIAASFSERKGIRYKTWREVGVPAKVLKQAGITR